MDARRLGSRMAVVGVVALALALALAACGGSDPAPPAAVCGDGLRAAGEGCDDHNVAPGDGCSAACQVEAGFTCSGSPSDCQPVPPAGVAVVQCAALAPLGGGTCQVTAGGPALLVRGTVLLPGQLLRGGEVAVDAGGLVACVGCDCAAAVPGATRVTCPRGVVTPGLVNAHDHLAFDWNPPRAASAERYEQRHDWRLGRRAHTAIPVSGGASTAQLQWAELRQLLAGTTSVVGSGGTAGLLRNLDRLDLREGLAGSPVTTVDFPLGDQSGTQLEAGCAYPAITSPASLAGAPAALLHAGEGIDATAHNELTCLTSTADGGRDLAAPPVALVNAVGVRALDWPLLAARGTALVWSPRSNVSLYGDTAHVTEAVRAGVQVALGTDWTVSGSADLLRELQCADQWNRERLDGFFTDEQLWRLATREAADVSGVLDQLGVLATGRQADLVVFDGALHRDFRAVLDAGPGDVALVLRGGRPLYGAAPLVEALAGAGCDALEVCGASQRVCLQALGTTLAALSAANAGGPPVFSCGEPAGQPTCTPSRGASVSGSTTYAGAPVAGDADGDGIPDAQDRCPTVFDPIRPLDGGAQPDADGDGVGDACDPCPLLADTTTCPAPDPQDLDGDGIVNAVDNCPLLSNPNQADLDFDGKGDACDACPTAPNPGTAPCRVSIYGLTDGTAPEGTQVAVEAALVTARRIDGFYLQVKEGDVGYAGPDFSGIWVQARPNTVAAGDRVAISSATLERLFGELRLGGATFAVTGSGEAPPAPVLVTAADVATGGARAVTLQGVLVEVRNVTVADVAPPPGPGDVAPTNEFTVDAGLRVDDLFHLVSPFPALGASWASISGVLAFRGGETKLEPRGALDLVAGPP